MCRQTRNMVDDRTSSGYEVTMNKNVNMCNGWYGLENVALLHALDFNGVTDRPASKSS